MTLLGGAAAAWPITARGQQAMPVFGILLVFSRESGRTFTEPLRAYMQALGYVEGRNIVFDVRYADGKVDRLPTLAAELVAQRAAVIATFGDATGLAVKAATATIPVVSIEDVVSTPQQIERALREAKDGGVSGVNVLSSALLFALRGYIINLAAELGLPAMYQWPETADEGGLIAYGPSLRAAFRQVTTLVDKVLKGAKPGDIPVEQPTRFFLVINLKTAGTLGLKVPPLTLLRADRAIE